MKVFTNQGATGPSTPVRCYGGRQGDIQRVNIFVSGLAGDLVEIEALLPDGSGWVPVSTDVEINTDGLYVVDAGANVLRLNVASYAGGTINAWIEPDAPAWRDAVRTQDLTS